MKVVALFTLEKVGFCLHSELIDGRFQFQLTAAAGTWPRIDAGDLHGVLHIKGDAASNDLVQIKESHRAEYCRRSVLGH